MKILASQKTSVAFVLLLGSMLSFYGFWMVQKERDAKIRSAFNEIVSDNAASIQRKLDDYFDEMFTLQSLYLSTESVSREEFRHFTERIFRRLPGIQALEWMPYVTGEDRAAFEQSMVQEGFMDFRIKEFDAKGNLREAGIRKRYFPITYFEPNEGNEKAFGYDFASETLKAEALSKASATKDFSVLSSVRIAQDQNRDFLVTLLPVYHIDREKREQLKGILLGAFRFDEIIRKEAISMRGGKKIFCFRISDVTKSDRPQEVYSERDFELSGEKPRFVLEEEFEVNGHIWKLTASPCLWWLENRRGVGPLSVLFAGLGATLLFALYLSLFIDRTKVIEHAVGARTAELAQANERISLSERNFRGLVSNIPGAVYRCAADKAWTMEFISDEIEKISGYPASDFIRNKIRSFASIIHPGDSEKVDRDVSKGIESKAPYILEYRILDSEGKEKWVYEKGQAIFSESGEVLYLDGAIFDITERKKLSEQLLQSRKMEAIGKFSGGIAHDFNNHLMVILGYCQLLLEKIQPWQPEHSQVSDILLAAEKSSALVRQLLAFGRKTISAPAIFDLNVLVLSIAKMMRTILGEKTSLHLNLSENLGKIYMDEGQMEQVLMNMVVNARDAMPDGGVLAVETRNVKILEDTKLDSEMPAGEYVVLSLTDTGMGMSPEVKKHLFEPFFSTKEKNQGTGLGLATCYAVIRAAHGFIEVQSRPGEGAVFNIYIPVSQRAVLAPKIENKKEAILSGHETILLVEDEEKVRMITALILKNRGYQVLDFASGKDALEFLEKSPQKVDLLLTDVIMPVMNGAQLAERARKIRPEMRMLFMSGYTEDALLRNGIEQRQVNFIHKPCEVSELCSKVREILDASAGPRAGLAAA